MENMLILVIVLALIFDFINGFHDAANSIATVVSTQVLSPAAAVVWAALFNFLAYWIFELKVADTVAKTVRPENITLVVVMAGLLASIFWNLLTWWYGIPSSSSHTLIGGFAGAGIAHAGGFDAVQYDKIMPTIYFIVLAPVLGMIMSYFISVITLHVAKNSNPSKIDRIFRRLQLLSSAAYSLGHGGNDAQKVMGIIAAAMISQHVIADMHELPGWVPLACYSAIALGTMIGGWKIVKTMGQKVTKLTPFEGFSAETAGALTLFGAQHFKIPVSTTHTITGSIVGVGLTKRISAVRWGVTLQLVWAWILTIPVSAALAGLFLYILEAVL
ncbi:MAG: inorganic phosphate transporter [Bacteroidia bacterium]|jgi:PiT family inorganic phosphate transporter|nr:inorganic phosphate transporter [Bacteroidota bacterium]MBP6511216.1 inorganic phosphate transporter [Bacteroidia bacterium]MBP7243988.1 inorganic phosphate transporter [Bacteroidia bacterium]